MNRKTPLDHGVATRRPARGDYQPGVETPGYRRIVATRRNHWYATDHSYATDHFYAAVHCYAMEESVYYGIIATRANHGHAAKSSRSDGLIIARQFIAGYSETHGPFVA